jgi:cyclophilin family peptidyl-prolyl cis-trans isomerase
MRLVPDVKPSILSCILALGCCSALQAQQIKAPESLRPSTAPVVPPAAPASAPFPAANVDKLAEEAQKSLYQAADKAGGGAPGQSGKTPSGPLRLPSPMPENPATWSKESVHKLVLMEVALGGTRETITIELYPDDAPQTVANFINHCDSGFYNGLAFHRAIEGFLVQTGDPLTSDESAREKWGTGGDDKTIPAEIKRPHRIGSLAMARRSDKVNPQRRSNGSQFYVALGNYAALEGKYTVFGQVVSGLEVLKHISIMPVDANDCPVARVEVKSIKVIDHKGPLQVEPEVAGEGRRYSTPGSSRGIVGRFLHRYW